MYGKAVHVKKKLLCPARLGIDPRASAIARNWRIQFLDVETSIRFVSLAKLNAFLDKDTDKVRAKSDVFWNSLLRYVVLLQLFIC